MATQAIIRKIDAFPSVVCIVDMAWSPDGTETAAAVNAYSNTPTPPSRFPSRTAALGPGALVRLFRSRQVLEYGFIAGVIGDVAYRLGDLLHAALVHAT